MDDATPGFGPDFADLQLARAAANNAANPTANVSYCLAAAPSNLTAPSSVVLAASLFTQKVSVVGLCIVTFNVTLAAAGTLTIVVQTVPTATAIAGGGVNGTWHFENGGAAVTVTGGSPQTLNTWTSTLATGALQKVLTFAFPVASSLGAQTGYEILVSSAQNLSAMLLNANMFEIL